jgi:signal transduction histidine kinase
VEDLALDEANVAAVLAGDVPSYQMEKRYIQKNGHAIWALLNVSLVRNADGTPNYFISQVHDITDRKEVENLKDEFVSMVSHELRTPLTSIRGSLGLIAGALSAGLPPQVNHLVGIAHKNAERLIALINDILDIDKIAAGKMRFEYRREALAPLVQQVVDANRAYSDKFGVTVEVEPIPEHYTINVDANRLTQALLNLLSNAAKFSPQGATVKVAVTTCAKGLRISVHDDGSGVPEDFQPRIFHKFSQADSSITREKGGTGLGLYITQQIISQMGGQIGFDTAVGQGSTFWFDFPDADAPSAMKA